MRISETLYAKTFTECLAQGSCLINVIHYYIIIAYNYKTVYSISKHIYV